MKEHFCLAEQSVITYQGECSWCGEKETLAQTQEPSGHFLDFAYSDSIAQVHVYDQFQKGQQFYTTPPQRTWVGLTDEEYIHITDSVYHQGHGLVAYYKAIEAKLKEKNT